jgi:hypothetical protein
MIEACAVGAPFSGPWDPNAAPGASVAGSAILLPSYAKTLQPCLEISAAAGHDRSVELPFERLPLYFRPRLAEGLPVRLQIRAFACEYPPDLRGNGCSHERRGCARRPIEGRLPSISRRVGGLHPGAPQKLFIRQILCGHAFVSD